MSESSKKMNTVSTINLIGNVTVKMGLFVKYGRFFMYVCEFA